MKRDAPCTPSSDHSRVCSGGEANIMNRRAVSAPKRSTSPSGSTPLFLDLDILPRPSCSTRSGPASAVATSDTSLPSSAAHVDVGGVEVALAFPRRLVRVDVVQHHALGQQVGEGLVELEQRRCRASPWSRSASTAGAGWRARCRRCTGPPAASSRRAHPPCARCHPGTHSAGSTRTSRRRCPWCRSRAAPRRRTWDSCSLVEGRRLGQRIAAAVRHQVLRQHHRQVLLRHRHLAAAARSG